MPYSKQEICCFSGYRPEKLHFDSQNRPADLMWSLEHATRRAAQTGSKIFLSGMSRGFDLWAAQTVIRLREALGLQLWCALPFPSPESRWEAEWRSLYQRMLGAADRVYCLSERYTPGCFHERNRFLVNGSSRMICYYDGQPGGTSYTVRLAQKNGLFIDNLAQPAHTASAPEQLTLDGGFSSNLTPDTSKGDTMP